MFSADDDDIGAARVAVMGSRPFGASPQARLECLDWATLVRRSLARVNLRRPFDGCGAVSDKAHRVAIPTGPRCGMRES